jgi:hypothetical protein
MKQVLKCTRLIPTVLIAVIVQMTPLHAQVQTRDAVPRGKSASARVVEVKGSTVVIADASGRRQTLQLAAGHGLKPGLPLGWCEDDCRTIRIGEASYAVKGRAPIK